MEQETALYLESHKRLLNWTQELEFLGYILSEIVDPHGLDKQGFTCHQAVDLPTIIYILRRACSRPGGRLRGVLSKQASKYFGDLLLRCKRIRNTMAHHAVLDDETMRTPQEAKEELGLQLQSVISQAASRYDIHQVC